MAHYAKILNGQVVDVMRCEDTFFEGFVDTSPGQWLQTSYNTSGGVHHDPETGEPSEDQSKELRKNFASVGDIYDTELDAFFAQKPFESWTKSQTTWEWEAPTPYPSDENRYEWNEATTSWVLLEGEQV
jgi:hypothetical protein